jgi:hypothetical protein
MSLINETLENLNSRNEEILINPSTRARGLSNKGVRTRSPQNFLILTISFGIIMALFYIVYNAQVNQYILQTKSYFTQKTGDIASNIYAFKDKLQINLKVEKSNKIVLDKSYSSAIQSRYYNAMNLLNEGNIEEAKKNLRIILKEDPNFAPARQAISMLKSDFK